jgi:hypothetical protein
VTYPKPLRQPRISSPLKRAGKLRHLGKRGRERLRLNSELHAQASLEGWHSVCEIAPILRERGIDDSACFGDLTFAHSMKAHKRGRDPVLDREVCRACTHHHFYQLDLLKPALTRELVLAAIARRV